MSLARRPSTTKKAVTRSPRKPAGGIAAHDVRFTARIPRAEKTLLQRAASRRGLSLSAYVFEKAHGAAIAELEASGELVLAPTDQQRFVDLVLDPPKPTAQLLRALRAAESGAGRR